MTTPNNEQSLEGLVERIGDNAAEVLETLYAAQEALGEYACHIGDKHPCIRTKDQCRNECGKTAGDAALKIDALLSALKDAS